jgi:uncharacterized RDD family membrane protein YckC
MIFTQESAGAFPQRPASMERTVDVATGESVAFTYELAGLGSRFFAVVVDLAIQIGVALGAGALFLWFAFASHARLGGRTHTAVVFAGAVVNGIAVFAIFMLFFGYFIFFEWRFAGRTPGKRLLGLRVVRDGGFPLDFTSAVVRNVVRILEVGIGFYAVSAVAMLLSPFNRRLGDMAAGTIVVRDARFELASAPVYDDSFEDSKDALVRDLSAAERDLVRRYVERRANLGSAPRASLAEQIAAGIRPKLGASFEHLGDDELLVYVASRGRP